MYTAGGLGSFFDFIDGSCLDVACVLVDFAGAVAGVANRGWSGGSVVGHVCFLLVEW
jgi:hypothetical protein